MIALVDYDAGNLASVGNLLTKLGYEWISSDDPVVLKKSTLLILPGVGAAGSGMASLRRKNLDVFLREQIAGGKPFLGICLGMQLLFERSEENNTQCLGILSGTVKKLRAEKIVPQIGWNEVSIKQQVVSSKDTFRAIPNNSYFYFVNSYYCAPEDQSIIAAQTTYGETFASVIVKNNIIATQFHPEKSSSAGFQLLQNILRRFYDNQTYYSLS